MALSGKVIWKSGTEFEASIREHKVVMDSPQNSNNKGPSPKELALIGIAGCSGMDVATILGKKRVDLKSCEISISTETTEGYPSIFKNVNITYEIVGGENLKESDALMAVELSMTKYCGVSAMFVKTCDMFYTVKLNDKEIGSGKADFKI